MTNEHSFSRRAFIASLFAIAMAPKALSAFARADEVPIDDATWSTLQRNPTVFQVDEFGTITLSSISGPNTRWEAYDLWTEGALPSRTDLKEAFNFVPSAIYEADEYYRDDFLPAFEDSVETAEDEDEAFVEYGAPSDWPEELGSSDDAQNLVDRLSEQHFAELAERMLRWAHSGNFGMEEHEDFHYPASGGDYAFGFFGGDNEQAFAGIGVKVVEGDRPGSNYCGAELRLPIDIANARAKEAGIPVRFEPE